MESSCKTSPSSEKSPSKLSEASNAKPSSGNRRKTGHHRIIEDDNISFETIVVIDHPSTSTTTKSPPKVNSSATNQPSPKKRKIDSSILRKNSSKEDFIQDGATLNHSLLEKVAFLRVSVNYLMLKLGLTPFDFSHKIELKDLMQAYNDKRRIADANRTNKST